MYGALLVLDRFGKASTMLYSSGSIDDVRLYSRALSTPEMQALYAGGW